MMEQWLHSPEHFCISPNGDFAGNKDTCYWGLPSIQAADPAYPPLGYWRGYVCAPPAACPYSPLAVVTRRRRVHMLPCARRRSADVLLLHAFGDAFGDAGRA